MNHYYHLLQLYNLLIHSSNSKLLTSITKKILKSFIFFSYILNMQINFAMNSNDDISFVELHRYITFLITSKKMTLDNETKMYIKNLQDKYIDLQEFENMSRDELINKKNEIIQTFTKQMNSLNEKFDKLKLIKEILEIDLNYYYKQLKNVNSILKNDNFKVSINIINELISSNQDLNETQKQQISFYNKLINQKIYIDKIILSDKMVFKSKKDLIKKELFIEMKNIQKETMIYINDIIEEKFDYKNLLNTYNDYELQKLLSALDEMIFEDKSESLRYKVIENLHKLTNKSYKEINLILKDKKFKEKLFGNLKLESVTERLNILSHSVNEYNQINHFITENKKIIHVCPLCNYKHQMPIKIILHLSLHNNKKYDDSVEFSFYHFDGNHYSTYSINKIDNPEDFIYNTKMNIFNDKDIVNSYLFEDINKGSFEDMRHPISLTKIIKKVDNMKNVNDFKNKSLSMNKEYGISFNMTKEINQIIEEQTQKMLKNADNKSSTKNTRIINFKIFKNIFERFIQEEDINNLYNTIVQFYDINLKSQSNTSFDLLFKNMIHYNNKKPTFELYQSMKKVFKIIRLIKQQKYSELVYSNTSTKIQNTESYQYVDSKLLILLIPLLKSIDLKSNIEDNLTEDNKDDEIKINDDFDVTSWADTDKYETLLNKIYNITKDDLIITSNNKQQTEEMLEQFVRLNEMFQNISMKKLKKMEKQYDLLFKSFKYMIQNNMFLHDIQSIDSDKNIQSKYDEYINGTFMFITMNYMNMLLAENKDNTENTKNFFDIVFKTLPLYLREQSKYLKKNKIIRKKVVNQNKVFLDNRDELLNDYFDSDDEDFNEEIINDDKDIFTDDDSFVDEEDLFGESD